MENEIRNVRLIEFEPFMRFLNRGFGLSPGEFERSYPGFAPKVAEPDSPETVSQRHVRYSHLDVNGHLNNVQYLDFVLDSFPADFRKEHDLVQLDMNFLNEALIGDRIEIRTQCGDGHYLHTLYRNKGKTELCRLKTRWERMG